MNMYLIWRFSFVCSLYAAFIPSCFGAPRLDLPDHFYPGRPRKSAVMSGLDQNALLNISIPFKMYGKSTNHLWVSDNGYVGFPFPLPHSSFPPDGWDGGLREYSGYSSLVIAFWTDHLLPLGGAVYYKEQFGDRFLSQANSDLQKFGSCLGNFSAKSVTVITWYHVHYGFECVKQYPKEFCDCIRINTWEFCQCLQDGHTEQFCRECYETFESDRCRCLDTHSLVYCECTSTLSHNPDYCDCLDGHGKAYCSCLVESGSEERAQQCECQEKYAIIPWHCDCLKKYNYDHAFCGCMLHHGGEQYCRCYLSNTPEFCDCYLEHENEPYCRCIVEGKNPDHCLCRLMFYTCFFNDFYLTNIYCDCLEEYVDLQRAGLNPGQYCWCLGQNGQYDDCPALLADLLDQAASLGIRTRAIDDNNERMKRQEPHPGNNYQAALISDGEQSYVIINFDEIVFDTVDRAAYTGPAFYEGFQNFGSNERFYEENFIVAPGACQSTDNFFGRKYDCRHTLSNVGVPGQWMYRLDENGITSPLSCT